VALCKVPSNVHYGSHYTCGRRLSSLPTRCELVSVAAHSLGRVGAVGRPVPIITTTSTGVALHVPFGTLLSIRPTPMTSWRIYVDDLQRTKAVRGSYWTDSTQRDCELEKT